MNLVQEKTTKVTGGGHQRLKKAGQIHETMNDVIGRLLDSWEEKKRR
jgi:hypothetical protein